MTLETVVVGGKPQIRGYKDGELAFALSPAEARQLLAFLTEERVVLWKD